MDERLEEGHFMKYLGAKAGSSQGGMEKMYASLPPKDGVHANGAIACTPWCCCIRRDGVGGGRRAP